MNEVILQIATGVVNGCLYAILALALVMIYRSTNHVNFAQGEMALLSTYVAASLIAAGAPYWIAALGAIVCGFVVGALIERIALRPLNEAPILSVVTVFVALLIIIPGAIGLVFGHHSEAFPSPFDSLGNLGGHILSSHALGTIGVTVLVLVGMTLFFRTTRLGLAMRAVAMLPLSSELSGINVRRILMLGWGLAGAIGAIAGLLVAPVVFLEPHMMSGVMIYAFAAAVLGGIDSPVGAIVGGLLIGIGENLLGAFVTGTELNLTIALVIMFSILVIKPQGLFGRRTIRRV